MRVEVIPKFRDVGSSHTAGANENRLHLNVGFFLSEKMECFVYILYSEKLDRFYIGSSYDPELRLHYHNLGKKGWTKAGIPWSTPSISP